VKVGDLVRYAPILSKYSVVGVVVAGNGGDVTKLLTPCGKIYWAVTKDCEVISESR